MGRHRLAIHGRLQAAGRRSLGRQISLNLLALGLLGLVAVVTLLHAIIDERFSLLEQHEVAGHLKRTDAALVSMQQTSAARTLDWAVWDDSFAYMEGRNPAYETTNLTASAFKNIDTQAMGFVRFDGTLTRSWYFDLASGKVDAPARAEFTRIIASAPLRTMMQNDKLRTGFLRLGRRVLVIGAAQVLPSDGSGKAAGYLVTAREVQGDEIARSLQLPARLTPIVGATPPTVTRSDEAMAIARTIRSIAGEPIAAVRFRVPRSLLHEGHALLWLTGGTVALLVGALIALLTWRLRKIVIRPIEAFQAHVSGISQSGELAPFDDQRPDELGALYREFNAMIAELDSLRATVEAQGFAIGHSESTIGIMHNVRNAISPVHAILSNLQERLQFPAEANVRRALDELGADIRSADSPGDRREQLLAFIDAAVTRARENLAHDRGDLREALRGLGQVVEAITNGHRPALPASELAPTPCDLTAVVQSSLRIIRHHPSLEIEIEFIAAERFQLAAPRVLIAQIIDNLLTNAAEAVAATGRQKGKIAISATRDPEAPGERVRMTLRDDGEGFAPDTATRFFERGSSTRQKECFGGIGLHWCANTVNALGGSITLSSDGPGHGAEAALLLPLARKAEESRRTSRSARTA